MNSLKLTLLLSLAPCVAIAGNCCEKTEVVQDEQYNDSCVSECNLTILKNENVCEATCAFVSVHNETISDENWEILQGWAVTTFGAVTEQTENSITFIFERNDLSFTAWLLFLAELEAKFLVLKEIIELNPTLTGGHMTIGVNSN